MNVQRKLGPEAERDLGETLWTLGDLLRLKGDYQAAEPLLRESLETFRKVEGDEHEDIVGALNLLGLMREAQGDVDGAEALYRQSVSILRKLPERRRITFADPPASLTSLGTILALKGKRDEAESYLDEAVNYYRQIGGDKSPAIGNPLRMLSYLHLLKGELARAEQEANNAVALERALPADNLDLSYSLYMLGLILTQEGKLTAAEARLRESLSMREAELRKGNIAHMAEGALGYCLILQKRYAEAEPLLIGAYQALKANLGERHPVTLDCLRALVQLYKAWGKRDQADHYRALLQS
jgi:tetratricopeptide (TPR) repeat protein